MTKRSTIIPVAGGKGGVGKSLIAANLAIALAQLGHTTVVIDLDLGGSNLHLMLGMQNDYYGIGDYLNNPKIQFETLSVQTEWPHLKFIPGDGITPFLANISFANKQSIIKEIKNLSAEYIILDLGAGTTFNTLDFFDIVNRGLLVTTTDRISVINMLSFLKNYLLRTIDRELPKNSNARIKIQEMYSRPMGKEKITIQYILNKLQESDKEAVTQIHQICKQIQPRIVYNMVRGLHELRLVDIINKSAKSMMSVTPNHIGAVFLDQEAIDSVCKGIPLLRFNEKSIAAQCIFSLAGEITQIWDSDLENTEKSFTQKTSELLEKVIP